MLPRSYGRQLFVSGALVSAAALALVACNGDDRIGTGLAGAPELEDGVLSVGSDIAREPFEFYQEGTETEDGLDIDLARAIAEALGVEVKFLNTGFSGLIPALQTEQFDVIVSAMTITDERSGQIDFVPYINVGADMVMPAGNYGIGVRKGSTELKDAIADAVQEIRDSGRYDEILAKWELEAAALP